VTAEIEENSMMQLPTEPVKLSGRARCLAPPARCPHCGERMVAPLLSEFVNKGTVRHHWACDDCGMPSQTEVSVPH
jgi:transcription elongation factor Elf1